MRIRTVVMHSKKVQPDTLLQLKEFLERDDEDVLVMKVDPQELDCWTVLQITSDDVNVRLEEAGLGTVAEQENPGDGEADPNDISTELADILNDGDAVSRAATPAKAPKKKAARKRTKP